MIRPVVVLRPEPGNTTTTAAARDLGLTAISAPLFETVAVPWHPPAATGYAGLLVGSAALFRLGGSGLTTFRSLPVHAVGSATAAAARQAGFAVAQVADGGLQSLINTLPPGLYLRLAGQAHVALDLPSDVRVDTKIVYAARPLPLPPSVLAAIRAGAVVLLHSGEAARHFAAECSVAGVNRSATALACLAPRIAQAAGMGWQTIEVAAERTDQALLALAAQLCQNP